KPTNSIKPTQDAAPKPNKKRRITDDDPNQPTIELVTGFEDNQIQSLNPKERSDLPITIPALKNADWLERSQALAAARSKESDKSKTTNVKTTSVKTLDNSVKTTSVKTTSVKILDNSVGSLKQQALDEILK
ncbi:21550_t:CDS:2, partial [Racocetra persica]